MHHTCGLCSRKLEHQLVHSLKHRRVFWFLCICPLHSVGIRVGNFRQKIIPRKTEFTEQFVCSGGIPAAPRNRKISEFRSEPFCRGEECSEFCTMEQKQKQNSRNSVLNHSAEQKTLGIPFRTIPQRRKMLILCKTNFFHAIFFRSEPRNWLFRKPRNASEWALSSAE